MLRVDYDETFSTFVRLCSLCYLLGLDVALNLNVEQIDAGTACLQDQLQEEV